MMKKQWKNNNGFTLIEIGIVLVIIGLLAGGGVSIMRLQYERKYYNETVDYLNTVKSALITYANNRGYLPREDTNGDGYGNGLDIANQIGYLPYLGVNTTPIMQLGVSPTDPSTGRRIWYRVNSNLTNVNATGRNVVCKRLSYSSGWGNPQIIQDDGSGTDTPTIASSVAIVLISEGRKDSDGDGNWRDDYPGWGTNVSNGSYIRHYVTENQYDDIVIYVTFGELMQGMECNRANLCANGIQINNNTGSPIGLLITGSPCQTWVNGSVISMSIFDQRLCYIDDPVGTPPGCTNPASGNVIDYDGIQAIDIDCDCSVSILSLTPLTWVDN